LPLWPTCTATSSKERWIVAYSIGITILWKLSCTNKKKQFNVSNLFMFISNFYNLQKSKQKILINGPLWKIADLKIVNIFPVSVKRSILKYLLVSLAPSCVTRVKVERFGTDRLKYKLLWNTWKRILPNLSQKCFFR
jgi:hypothetical protein